ncbi:uncharacterized protein LOC128229691 [Mya arenaria]|uniref:uncharacterized protein LOC128229691 n=1 Tax=Mya arenaria TaxID=6604 RepID=UPI0022E00C8C|nr:uncharacterized protein LOC128229691 [Mya arenaria]
MPNEGEYCCGNECCELIEGISGQTWMYISGGVSVFFIILIVIICCLCVRMRKVREAKENAMTHVVNPVPEAQIETGTGQSKVINTVQQQNPSGTPADQPMKSSALGTMVLVNYALASKHENVTKYKRGGTAGQNIVYKHYQS